MTNDTPNSECMVARAPVLDRFKNKEYLNWIKLSQALVCVAEGLVPFCKRVVKEFHDSLKAKIGLKICTAKCTYKNIKKQGSVEEGQDEECNEECTAEDKPEMHDTDEKKGWVIECPDDICNKWFAGIIEELCGSQYAWKNTDVRKWPKQPWQLAKMYMAVGQQPSQSDPAKTDALGLLQLIINCRKFHVRLQKNNAVQVIFCLFTVCLFFTTIKCIIIHN